MQNVSPNQSFSPSACRRSPHDDEIWCTPDDQLPNSRNLPPHTRSPSWVAVPGEYLLPVQAQRSSTRPPFIAHKWPKTWPAGKCIDTQQVYSHPIHTCLSVRHGGHSLPVYKCRMLHEILAWALVTSLLCCKLYLSWYYSPAGHAHEPCSFMPHRRFWSCSLAHPKAWNWSRCYAFHAGS